MPSSEAPSELPRSNPSHQLGEATMALIHNVVGPPTAERVLLLVHGYGADERDLGGLLPLPRPRGSLPRRCCRGGPWRRRPGSRGSTSTACSRTTTTDATLHRVARGARRPARHRLRRARHRARRGRRRRVLPGRRRSRSRSASAGRTAPHPAGVLAMSPYLPDVDGVELDWDAARTIPVLVQHGTEDPMIPVERRPRARARAGGARRPDRLRRVPDGPRGRARERRSRRTPGSTRSTRASSRRSRCPSRRPSRW